MTPSAIPPATFASSPTSQTHAVSFSDRLVAAIQDRGTPACIGLDPKRDALPPALGAASLTNPKELALLFTRFCCDVIDAVAPLVPIVKPQLACFEAIGPHGMAALADVIAHAHAKHLLVLADGKRSDIGSTAEAYADGWLAGPWGADALTVNPYSASKAAAEMIINSYRYSYKKEIIIIRGNNIYGPRQYPEKLISSSITNLINNRPITLHGSGNNKRHYISVVDFAKAR